jgi:hypothetical protein
VFDCRHRESPSSGRVVLGQGHCHFCALP